ncbi:MAG TPA: hypothetical protein VNW90_28745 [Acetobacteraceae bacterium]|nr:hypothetical protein [Acetobacteraceae bacterium]
MSPKYIPVAARDEAEAEDQETVMVPLNRKALVPTSSERVRRLRKHLVASLRAMRTMKDPVGSASPLRPEPDGLNGKVARVACALCRGFCCKGGGEHAYLDERVMARVRQAQPELDARTVMRLYVERVPAIGYEGSCVFHGSKGCTLDRSLRSDVCNSYFCSGLGNHVKSGSATTPVVVIAGEGGDMRTSPLLGSDR